MQKIVSAQERRKTPRLDRCGDYLLYPETRDAIPCELKNISVTGACIATGSQLKIDQIVELHICRNRDLPLRSQVVWIKTGEYGLSFLLDSPEAFSNISFIMNNEAHH